MRRKAASPIPPDPALEVVEQPTNQRGNEAGHDGRPTPFSSVHTLRLVKGRCGPPLRSVSSLSLRLALDHPGATPVCPRSTGLSIQSWESPGGGTLRCGDASICPNSVPTTGCRAVPDDPAGSHLDRGTPSWPGLIATSRYVAALAKISDGSLVMRRSSVRIRPQAPVQGVSLPKHTRQSRRQSD